MLRHAYMIGAHNQFALLALLLKTLDHPQNDFYIHIDSKVKDFDFEEFSHLTKHSRVFFTDRLSINWGGYNQIEMQYILLKAAFARGYDRYHMMSGVDLPLRSAGEIVDFFESRPDEEFVHFSSPEFCRSDNVRDRVRYYHWLQEKMRRDGGFLNLLERVSLRLQRMLGVDRTRKLGMELKCGAVWYSITHKAAAYILSKEAWTKRHFCHTRCGDEEYLHTLLWNSPFRGALHLPNDVEDHRSCRRYVIWDRQVPGEPPVTGQPYVFRDGDLAELEAASGEYLFARKFDILRFPELCRQVAEKQLKG